MWKNPDCVFNITCIGITFFYCCSCLSFVVLPWFTTPRDDTQDDCEDVECRCVPSEDVVVLLISTQSRNPLVIFLKLQNLCYEIFVITFVNLI